MELDNYLDNLNEVFSTVNSNLEKGEVNYTKEDLALIQHELKILYMKRVETFLFEQQQANQPNRKNRRKKNK